MIGTYGRIGLGSPVSAAIPAAGFTTAASGGGGAGGALSVVSSVLGLGQSIASGIQQTRAAKHSLQAAEVQAEMARIQAAQAQQQAAASVQATQIAEASRTQRWIVLGVLGLGGAVALAIVMRRRR